jgi:hypothetical protein
VTVDDARARILMTTHRQGISAAPTAMRGGHTRQQQDEQYQGDNFCQHLFLLQ